jgi:hypothetical protein
VVKEVRRRKGYESDCNDRKRDFWATMATRQGKVNLGAMSSTTLKETTDFQMLSIPAVVRNGKAVLLDRQGNALAKGVPLHCVTGEFDKQLAERWMWFLAAQRLSWRYFAGHRGKVRNPWVKKANNLAASFRLRSYDLTRPRGRCRFEQYPTHTWKDAAKRMWHQGNNHYRLYTRSCWARWAHTVSSNHNKRVGGRYGKAKISNCEDDS